MMLFDHREKYIKMRKLLNLDKPLIFFDIEATGRNISSDKIIEIAYIKVWDTGVVKRKSIVLDPEIKISKVASAVHGITNEAVKGRSKFRERAQEIWEIFNDVYFSGFGIMNFDLPLLRREFIRVGMDFDYSIDRIIDVKEIHQFMTPRNLANSYEFYMRKDFREDRSALNNSMSTSDILLKQLEKYEEIRDREFIKKISTLEEGVSVDSTRKFYWKKGKAYFAISKYKDKSLAWVLKEDPDFLKWILVSDFPEETKSVVRAVLEYEKK